MYDVMREKVNNLALGFADKRIADMFVRCFFNTLDTTCKPQADGSVFVITGDIPAMWLRDSSLQVMQYVPFCSEDEDCRALIKGVLRRQFACIAEDGYANAFMQDEGCKSEWAGRMKTDRLSKLVWERKYELDSLCYPLYLCAEYYRVTGDASVFDGGFTLAFDTVMDVVERESCHSKFSTYYYKCKCKHGKSAKPHPAQEKGLIWSAFRPSDDACKYNFNIPANMLLVSVLCKMQKIFDVLGDNVRGAKCGRWVDALVPLIERYGITEVGGVKVYALETDCLGRFVTDDDANLPGLLGLPLTGYPFLNKDIYNSTRAHVLSRRNKYYYRGSVISGIGSSHTPKGYVWHMAVAVQGITAESAAEVNRCFQMLTTTDAGTGFMHESVCANNPAKFTRGWFAWANSMFAQFVVAKYNDIAKQ